MSPKKPILSRRNFLVTLGAGGAAAAATMAGKGPSTAAPSGGGEKRATSGYKVSAHIENYYRTTKV